MSRKIALVAHPSPAVLLRVQEAFQGTDIDVVHTPDGAGLQAGGAVDIAFVGLRLHGGASGYELARATREAHPAALILLLSSAMEVLDRARADSSGADGTLNLPTTAKAIRARVEGALGGLGAEPAPAPRAAPAPAARPAESGLNPSPVPAAPAVDERLATFLPREYRITDPVSIDPALVGPALERAIVEVLPEVVEGILRNALVSSPAFRDIVRTAVDRAVAEQLPGLLRAADTHRK